MKTDKPTIVFDLETTEIPGTDGSNPSDHRIVQLCFMKMGTDEFVSGYVNPCCPISKKTTDIHHITDDTVKNATTFAALGAKILAFIDGCNLVGYNSNHFDSVVLGEEFSANGFEWDFTKHVFIDAFNIFRKKEPRDLAAAVAHYCKRKPTSAHNASGDVIDTMDVFMNMLKEYPELDAMTAEELAAYSSNSNRVDLAGKLVRDKSGVICYGFGKNIGRPVTAERSYAVWMEKNNFPESTKVILRKVLKGELQ